MPSPACKTMEMTMVTISVFTTVLDFSTSAMQLDIENDSRFDKITHLPGQPPVNFQQYAGYVTVSGDDKKHTRALFYYFVEAETHPDSKPLVLRLELVLSLRTDHPAKGMYSSEMSIGGIKKRMYCIWKHLVELGSLVLLTNLLMLVQMTKALFPQYKNRSLYIAGESYAGHYIPQLAELVQYDSNKAKPSMISLKGLALGNPLLDFRTDLNSRAEFMWSHRLISDATYKMFTSVCNYSRYVTELSRGTVSSKCSKVMSLVTREDTYDVTLDVCLSTPLSQSKIISPHVHCGLTKCSCLLIVLRCLFQFFLSKYRMTSLLTWRPHVCNLLQQLGQPIDVCLEGETANYLNRKDVQKALHAHLVGIDSWAPCSSNLDYDMEDVEKPTISTVGKLIKAGIPVLVYSGDQDSVIH